MKKTYAVSPCNSSGKNRFPVLAMCAILASAMMFSGCASGAIRVISAPAKPLASYRSIALQMEESPNVTYGGQQAEINKVQSELVTKLTASKRYSAVYDFSTQGHMAEVYMQVKPIYLYTGMNKMSMVFYYGPPVVLEVSIFSTKTKQLLASFQADGYDTGIKFGGAMGLLQSAVSTDSSIINAVAYVDNYISGN